MKRKPRRPASTAAQPVDLVPIDAVDLALMRVKPDEVLAAFPRLDADDHAAMRIERIEDELLPVGPGDLVAATEADLAELRLIP